MARVAEWFGRRGTREPEIKIATPEGRPLKILVRGDCTSRRSVRLNTEMFDGATDVVQNQKSTFVQFLDAAQGFTVPPQYLIDLSDVEAMPRTLQVFYLGQADRSVLTETGADLLMLDTWADLNFALHEHREHGFKLWMHPKFLRDGEKFEREHVALGRRTLEQSVEDAATFIRLIRRNNPEIPVLFLNQQVDQYPRLPEARVELYYTFGQKLVERMDNVYFGGVVPKADLQLDDIGSAGGPGNTLHFKGPTYRRMWAEAMANGLGEAIERRVARSGEDAPTAAAVVSPLRVSSGAAQEVRARIATDREVQVVDTLTFDGGFRATCTDGCRKTVESMRSWLSEYLYLDSTTADGLPPLYTPMLIDLEEHESFDEWEQSIKKFAKGARLRQKRKALERGYYTHEFARRLHVPDIHEINTSMEVRSGGPIRASLTRSIEELGGYPTELLQPVRPGCAYHWNRSFGVFQSRPGHMQGEVEVSEQLVGRIQAAREGEFAVYTQMIGHGEHNANGVMTLLHHDVIQALMANEDGLADGLRYVMYGGAQNGTPELFRFKRQAGFKPYVVDLCISEPAPSAD